MHAKTSVGDTNARQSKPLVSDAAELFAFFYALFSGLVFISVIGIVLAPAAHRALHLFHLDEDDSNP
ncbi:MAG: hypothetical protein IPK22_05070 [Verrucomicrobiaceae bacterium]|nr:hypothetical protein [Verrucomicrobiaceae bacterium]